MNWKVQLFKLNYDHHELDAINDVISSGWLTMGQRTVDFESNFSSFIGSNINSLAVSSCTSAIHMSLIALGVGIGDEVIVPSLTFIADANAVRMTGAKVTLADCSSFDNWNVSARSIENAITPQTKAVIVVHYAGFPCDMGPIVELCRSKGLFLIEDVAHAPGASVDGIKCGAWGDISCFSFFTNKNLSIGEGGMVATSNQKFLFTLKELRSHGMTSLTLDRHMGRAISYDVTRPSLNYRMDEIRAAIGSVQLKKLSSGNSKREELFNLYREKLKKSKIKIPFSKVESNHVSAYHILPILLPENCNRISVINSLKDQGIQTSVHYPFISNFSAYKNYFSPNIAPIGSEISSRQLTLPLYPNMSVQDVNLVTSSLLNIL
jgi:dTDP-4-amino-4,6-dideoxygalactose transaminase